MVVIKDMKEMPKSCVECPYGLYWGSISTCIILANDEIDIQENMLKGTRYEYCPLTDAEGHKVGKWIDCGFIDKSFRQYKCSNCGNFVYEKEYLIKYHKYCLHCGNKNER